MGEIRALWNICGCSFEQRRDFVVDVLNQVPGFRVSAPDGAFYAFPNVTDAVNKAQAAGQPLHNSLDLANYLLEQAHVAVVPGEAFGAPGYLRLSYACSVEQIKEGVHRIQQSLQEILGTPAGHAAVR